MLEGKLAIGNENDFVLRFEGESNVGEADKVNLHFSASAFVQTVGTPFTLTTINLSVISPEIQIFN